MVPGTYNPMLMNTGGSITFIGEGGRYTRDGNGSLEVGVHANTVSGDYVVCVAQYDQDSSIGSVPATWNLISFDTVGSSFRYVVFGKIYTGTPPTITLVSGGDQLIAACLTFRNVNASTQIDATPSVVEQVFSVGSNTITSHPATTVANCFYIDVLAHDYNTSSSTLWSGWTNSDLEGYTELVEYSTTLGWDGGFAVAGGIKETAGAVADSTVTSSINKDMGYTSFALRPA